MQSADDLHNLGISQGKMGNFKKSLEYFNKALMISEGPKIYNDKGVTLMRLHKFSESWKCFRKAKTYPFNIKLVEKNMEDLRSFMDTEKIIELSQEDALFFKKKNMLYHQMRSYETILEYKYDPKRIDEISLYYDSINRIPDEIHILELACRKEFDIYFAHRLMNVYSRYMHLHTSDLYKLVKKVLMKDNNFFEAFNCLGRIYAHLNNSDFIKCFLLAMKNTNMLKFKYTILSNMLFTSLHRSGEITYDRILYYSKKYDTLHSQVKTLPPQEYKKHHIGYVFNTLDNYHTDAVYKFMNGILKEHDKKKFRIFIYQTGEKPTNLKIPDTTIRSLGHLTNEMIAKEIYKDKINILVDLMGHVSGGSLEIFKYKPANINITYCSYPATTGLSCMDYKLTDRWLTPDKYYGSELPLFLNKGVHTFNMADNYPNIEERKEKILRIACLQKMTKITDKMLKLYKQVIDKINNCTFIFKSMEVTDGLIKDRFMERLRALRFPIDKIEFVGYIRQTNNDRSLFKLFQFYNTIDFALDTFPYNGTTSTAMGLMMGIPTVTLSGKYFHERTGCSILMSIGKKELVAFTEEEFVEKAVKIADRKTYLNNFVKNIREDIQKTVFGNSKLFVKELEEVYSNLERPIKKSFVVDEKYKITDDSLETFKAKIIDECKYLFT